MWCYPKKHFQLLKEGILDERNTENQGVYFLAPNFGLSLSLSTPLKVDAVSSSQSLFEALWCKFLPGDGQTLHENISLSV